MHADDFPVFPRASVRIAQTPEENAVALERAHLAAAARDIEAMTDAGLLALLEEPDTFVDLTPLEKELTIRLGAAWELIERLEVVEGV